MPRPQFSLKTVLWLMAVVAVALVGFSQGRRYEREQLAVERERLVNEEKRLALDEERLIDGLKDLVRRRLLEEAAKEPSSGKRRYGNNVWIRGDSGKPSFLDE